MHQWNGRQIMLRMSTVTKQFFTYRCPVWVNINESIKHKTLDGTRRSCIPMGSWHMKPLYIREKRTMIFLWLVTDYNSFHIARPCLLLNKWNEAPFLLLCEETKDQVLINQNSPECFPGMCLLCFFAMSKIAYFEGTTATQELFLRISCSLLTRSKCRHYSITLSSGSMKHSKSVSTKSTP